jgi:hypothetical protein
MTAESVFQFYRAYKLFFQGKYDFKKYRGNIRTAPLIQQPERRYYYRIAQKLNDAQIHALMLLSFFKKPNAFVTDLATTEAFQQAVAFASRAENGRPLFEAELYRLVKYLETWTSTHGSTANHGQSARESVPECQQMVIAGELNVDLACMLLLIPRPEKDYNWATWKDTQPACGFGPLSFVNQLRRVDQLIVAHRPGWRMLSYDLSKNFWGPFPHDSLAPRVLQHEATLF